jgi:hypothetical protein
MRCALFAVALVVAAPIAARAGSIYTTDFGSFSPGDVQGQQGWAYPGNSPTVGSIVSTPGDAPAGVGAQSLSLTETTNPSLLGVADGVNGPRVTPAGEPGTSSNSGTAVNNDFFASFYYRTPDVLTSDENGSSGSTVALAINPASSLSSTVATRYAFFALAHDPINSLTGPESWQFEIYTIGTNTVADTLTTIVSDVQPGTWYKIAMNLQFVPGTNADGTSNDIFSATVDDANGNLLGSGSGGSWETCYLDPSCAGTSSPLAVDTLDILNRYGPTGTPEGDLANLEYGTTEVPEPASLALLGFAMVGLAASRRRGCTLLRRD